MSWFSPDDPVIKEYLAKEAAQGRPQIAAPPRSPAHTPGEMNKTERAYAATLEARKQAGEVAEYHYEGVKLRLGHKCWYTPDFAVQLPDGRWEMHEVKGWWRDDARTKIKVAAAKFAMRFVAVTRAKGGRWEFEVIKGRVS